MLFTEEQKFRYRIKEKVIIPYLGNETNADIELLSYAAPQKKEMVTIISCWPYTTNSHRIVVVATRVQEED